MRERRGRLAVVTVVPAAVALGVVAVVLKVADGSHPLADVVVTTSSGVLFLVAGVVAHRRAPANPCGPLMATVGLGLFAEDLQLATDPVVFTVGLVVAHASTPLVVHLVLAFPDGRLSGRLARAVVTTAYVNAFVVSGVGCLVVDWAARNPGKPDNLLLVVDSPAAGDVVSRTLDLTGLVVGAAVLVVLAARLATARPGARWPLGLVLSVALVGAGCAAVAGALGSDHPSYALVLVGYQVAFCLWPLTFAVGVVRFSPRVRGVADLLVNLREPCSPADLRDLLARALRDPGLVLGEWDPEAADYRFVDDAGRPVTPGPGERAVALARHRGRPVAALMRRDTTWDDPKVIEAVGAVVGLVTDHHRLLDENRESRRAGQRLVELADAERRRVERDLHDGAQQRLVTVALGLRLARRRLSEEVEPELSALLTASAEGLDAAMAELRDLARGIHPTILTQAGLAAAAAALLERTPLRVGLTAPALPRLPAPVEATAYFVVAEAVTNALKHARATAVVVDLAVHDGHLSVSVRDDGVGGASPAGGSGLDGLLDRVRALDGTLTVRGGPGAGTTVSASIPVAAP